MATIGLGLRACNSLQRMSLTSLNLSPSLFSRASSLDNLESLTLWEFKRSEAMISALAAYMSRTPKLEGLHVHFDEQDADLSTFVKAVNDNKTLKILTMIFNVVQENDSAIMFDLISNTRTINDLGITAKNLKEEDFYLAFEHFETNESIVKLQLSANDLLHIDYERIAESISKNRTVNDLHVIIEDENEGVGLEVDTDSADNMFEMCDNLDSLIVGDYERARSRGDELDLENIIKISRTLAGSQMTKESRLPRELLNIMLYEGFKHLNWFDNQLSVVVRALLDRRTLGIVAGDLLPLSRPFLYVRCRDALDKIAN